MTLTERISVNYEFGTMWEEETADCFEVMSQCRPTGAEENHENNEFTSRSVIESGICEISSVHLCFSRRMLLHTSLPPTPGS
jgi:hypothetical protein